MSDGLKPYPAYKDSGVPWLGQVPEHWEIRRLGSSVRGCVNGVWGLEPNGKDDLPCVRVADFDRSRLRVHLDKPTMRAISSSDRVRRLLKPGDLLLEKSGGGDLQPVGRVVLYDHPTVAVTSNFIARMPVENGYDSIYLTYLHAALYSIELNVRSIKQTTGIQNLDSRTYLSELVAFPPLPEQTAIVRFLDWAERRIRRYIRAKQKLIKLLEEYKQALIHRAVTGQIDVRTGQPYPAYKPSGVEWLGQVPEHWEVVPLRRMASGFNNGTSVEQISRGTTAFPVSRIETISTGTINYDKVGFIREENVDSRFWLEPGDILLSHINSFEMVGNCAQFLGERPLLHGMNLIRIRPKNRAVGAFMFRFMKSAAFRYEMRALCKPAINQVSVTTTAIKGIHMPLPPLPEQTTIVEYLDTQTAKIDTAIEAARREIELLREYRTRLIADVVTGKVDVREVAARLPEEPPEEEAEWMDTDEIAEDETIDEEAGTETVEEEEVEP